MYLSGVICPEIVLDLSVEQAELILRGLGSKMQSHINAGKRTTDIRGQKIHHRLYTETKETYEMIHDSIMNATT